MLAEIWDSAYSVGSLYLVTVTEWPIGGSCETESSKIECAGDTKSDHVYNPLPSHCVLPWYIVLQLKLPAAFFILIVWTSYWHQ